MQGLLTGIAFFGLYGTGLFVLLRFAVFRPELNVDCDDME
jgi:hypothetical protein